MSKIIGLTGGIGSGKTTIAQKFSQRGIPIYNADERAKLILNKPEISEAIVSIFSKEILNENQKIDRKKLAQIVFNQPEKLQKLNEIIHPQVGIDFKNWVKEHQNNPLLIKEAAILIESGSYKSCDYVILIKASLPNRIKRVMARDQASEKEVLNRINNQWSDAEKSKFANFIIQNDDFESLEYQIDKILKRIL